MNALDIAYGEKIGAALQYVRNSVTIRLLGRETRLTFADMVDEWIDRQDAGFVHASAGEKVNGLSSWEFRN